jgi:hypothetical protein
MPPRDPRPRGVDKPAESETSSRRQLVGAFQDVVKAETARKVAQAKAPVPPRTHWSVLALSAVAIVFGGYLLIARPAWFIAPPPPPIAQSPEVAEASLRLGMGREAERVEAFRRKNGRLPQTLKEAGGGRMGLQYSPMGTGRYTISGTDAGIALTYDSIDSISTFVGNSYQLILRRFKP